MNRKKSRRFSKNGSKVNRENRSKAETWAQRGMAAKPGQERSAEGGLRGSRDAAAGGPLSLSPAVTSSGHRASTVIIDSGDAGTHNPDGKAWLGTQLHCLSLSFSLFFPVLCARRC